MFVLQPPLTDDQRKAEGREQEAFGINPDSVRVASPQEKGTSLLATKGSKGFKPPLNFRSVAPVHSGSESPTEGNLLPSASCLLPSQKLGWKVSQLEVDSGCSKFDLTFNLEERPEGMIGAIEYNTDLFDAASIERAIRHLMTLLEGIVAHPETSIAQLPLLTETERHQLLVEWNDTAVNYPHKCIHQLFEEQVEKTPDAVAVVFEDRQLTYRELNSRANQLARYLQKLGIKPESLVGICVERSLEMIVGLLGILKAGGAYIPIDPTYPSERISYMLENSQVQVLLTQSHLKITLPEYPGRVIALDSDWDVIATESEENPISGVTPDNLIYIIYTSGSTGKPKGAGVYHRGFTNLVNWFSTDLEFTNSDRVMIISSVSFDLTQKNFYASLIVGGQLHLLPSPYYDTQLVSKLIERHKITWINCAPSVFYPLVELENESNFLNLQSLRYVVLGGEPISVSRLWSLLQSVDFQAQIINSYGPTECTDVSTAYRLEDPASFLGKAIPIGRPIFNVEHFILSESLQLLPVGVVGELYIGGEGVGAGYLNRPDLNTERFLSNPFKAGARMYKTGDLARYLPDGNIEYLGRIDNQVKIRGFRIEIGEIENVLEKHLQVEQGVVIAREDTPGDKRLVAYIVSGKSQLSINELREFINTQLPDYMIPSAFVFLDALPLTPNGKIDRRALPDPEPYNFTDESNFVAPRNQVELQLAEIWSEVLNISPVGVRDNFIELGGHSLLATKIMARMRDRFGVELPLNCLFECPTVAELAKIVTQVAQEERANPLPSLEPISREQTIPLSFGQEQLWFLSQLAPSEPIYNETFTIDFGGDINIQALSKSLTELIRRHEILRTTFRVVNGQPVQEIHPPSALTLPVVDLRSLSKTEGETQALRIATEQLRDPFDLAKNSLLRATLIQLAETDYRLYLAVHHIVVDGESLTSIFLPELETIYTAFCQDLPSPLAELTIQYADFAVGQRQWLQGEMISNQLAYWVKQLENLPQLQLPSDRPHTPETTFAGSRVCFILPKDLTEKLKTISRKEGVTLFMTLATAINILLYRYSSQEDIVIGTVTSQRNRPELQGVMGDFLNTLVLRSDLSGNPSFRELLKRVRNVILSAYANQDVPFEQVVNAVHPDRHVSQNPLFQVMFVFQPPLTDDKLGWKVSQFEVDSGSSKFDLTFNLEERPEGMSAAIEYNTDLFDVTTIERAIGHLMSLLEGIVANPETSIAQLPLLTEAELHQLLVEWNNTQAEYPKDKCIHQLFEEQVERTPDAVAVVFEDRQLTYHQLNCQANQLAH
ncbi:MAG: amino acid adenylation domain-containing protein, partial [Okeania sp. SIO2C2]|nr:amino acid adenylation domain-containing protein [Okeania sp. SIO2C2]